MSHWSPKMSERGCSLLRVVSTHHGPLHELILAGLAVLLLASPGLECGGLQGAAVGEGEGPGPVQGTLVDGIQVDGGLLLTLTARQEGHAWSSGGGGRGGYTQQ